MKIDPLKNCVLLQDKDELSHIAARLAQDGMRSDLTDEQKLRYVWRLFERSDLSLGSALEDVEELRLQQGKEMLEVRACVEINLLVYESPPTPVGGDRLLPHL